MGQAAQEHRVCVLLCRERSSEHGSREPWLCVLLIALAQCEWHQAGHGAAAEVPIGGSEGERRAEETPGQGCFPAASLGTQAEEGAQPDGGGLGAGEGELGLEIHGRACETITDGAVDPTRPLSFPRKEHEAWAPE